MKMLKTFIIASLFSFIHGSESENEFLVIDENPTQEAIEEKIEKAPLAKRPSNEELPGHVKKRSTTEEPIRINTELLTAFQTYLHKQLISTPTIATIMERIVAGNLVELNFTKYQDKTEDPKKKLCRICSKSIHTNEITSHVLRHGNILFKCPIAGCIFKGTTKKETLSNHLQSINSTGKPTIDITNKAAHDQLHKALIDKVKQLRTKQHASGCCGSVYLLFAVQNN